MITPEVAKLLRAVRLLALDVDGVLTDGGVYVDSEGRDLRRFDIKDGLGLKRVMAAGITVALISGSHATPIHHRARELGIAEVYTGVVDKLAVLYEICLRLNVALGEVAYVGDDLPDLEVMECVGVACSVADGVAEVRAAAAFVTQAPGGRGAVREIAEAIVWARQREVAEW